MKEKIIEKVISLLDPIGVYGLGPLDEYEDIAKKSYELLINKEYILLRQYLMNQFPNKKDIPFEKLELAMEVLIYLMNV